MDFTPNYSAAVDFKNIKSEYGFDKITFGSCTNESTGETFKSIQAHKGKDITFITISSRLTINSARELAEHKEDYQVVPCTSRTGKSYLMLCGKGNHWEDVDI